MRKSIFKTLIATALVLVLSIPAVAWFLEAEDISPDVHGSAMTGYFYAGNGSIDHPYQLKSAKHVYNLAWLQYMGYLNEEDPNTGKINQLYFELIDDIDMDGIILPPIGTTENPFVGHFDGNSFCISNLTVSNYLSGENNELKIVQRPLSVTEIDGESVSIIGFFGVVGALDDALAAKLADDSAIEDITQKVNSIHDLFLEDLTVRTETTESLIGLVAGYANGSIVNVGVAGESGIQLGTRTQPLQSDEVDDITYAVSFYSLIGQYNATNIVWKDKPTGGLVDGDVDAPGAGWGSSINMFELRKRVTYISTAGGFTSTSINNYFVDAYGYSGWFSSTQAYTVSYTSRANRAYFLDGTAMPLSIEQSIFSDENLIMSTGSTKYPIGLNYYEDNKATNKEPVLLTNSGYVVGGGNSRDTSYINYQPEYPLGYSTASGLGVYKSLSENYVTRGAFPANDSNFVMHLLTVASDGTTYVIQDDYNTQNGANKAGTYFSANATRYSFARYDSKTLNFAKYLKYDEATQTYSGVRNDFVSSNAGEALIHGIFFNNKINIDSLEIYNTGNDTVTLLNATKSNYQMIKGAINFSLLEAGVATTVLGTFNTATTGNNNQSMFTILKVERDAATNSTIENVYIIEKIYEVTSPAKGEERYVYQYSDGSTSGNISDDYRLVYNRSTMTSLTERNALYYFEIPLNAGDYAIGSTVDDTSSAFLVYLDIGANGDKTLGEEDDGSTGTETAYHQIEGVTFVDSLAVEAKSTDGYSVVTFKVAISESGYGKSHGGLSLAFNRSSKTDMTVTETDSGGVFSVDTIEDDDDLTVTVGPPSG